jgi:hypothetical protein
MVNVVTPPVNVDAVVARVLQQLSAYRDANPISSTVYKPKRRYVVPPDCVQSVLLEDYYDIDTPDLDFN